MKEKNLKEKYVIISWPQHVEDEAGTLQKTINIGAGANNVAWLGPKEKELLVCSCDDGTLQVS